jgi:malonyl-CoA/methylmalonyl-CoA synthetase
MIVNGINIYPIEIEQTLKKILGVLDVVVMPIKHYIYQDIPIAVVSIDPRSNLTSNKLREIAVSTLGFRAPRKVVVVNEIPRNMNGKVQANELSQLIKKNLDKPDSLIR